MELVQHGVQEEQHDVQVQQHEVRVQLEVLVQRGA